MEMEESHLPTQLWQSSGSGSDIVDEMNARSAGRRWLALFFGLEKNWKLKADRTWKKNDDGTVKTH